MHSSKNVYLLVLSLIACLGNSLPAISQEDSNSKKTSPIEVILTTPKPSGSGTSCFDLISDNKADFEKELRESNQKKPIGERQTEEEIQKLVNEKMSFRSERVELYYYRNAKNIVSLLAKLPLGDGCPTILPLNAFQAGQGVGRGGGNVISLYGTQDYIEDAKRFITSLDLPLPGVNLQMWGVQISGKDPNRLAETTHKVRRHITETQRLLRETFSAVQGISQLTLQSDQLIDSEFTSITRKLGYADAIDGFGGESSILEVFLVGNTVKNPTRFYQQLYDKILAPDATLSGSDINLDNEQDTTLNESDINLDNEQDTILNESDINLDNEQDTTLNESDANININQQKSSPSLQPYLDLLKKETDRPPFERIFRSRGLEPYCINKDYEELKKKDKNDEVRCEKWKWRERFVKDLQGKNISVVKITSNFERKVLLEFALFYAEFLSNPDEVDPEELQRTAENLNEILQTASNLLQKDIEDFFIKPTLSMIQKEVANDNKLEFAQVGRNTISTLDGVETAVSTSSTSGFQISQSQDLEQLLTRAEALQGAISNFLPTEAFNQPTKNSTTSETSTTVTTSTGTETSKISEVSEFLEVAATGVPLSRLLGLAVAALEQKSIPIEIETGTSLAFTPGISRNLNSAEININLTVVNPGIKPTSEAKNVPPISRIGKHELSTTVYTQALDFFELSTFTSQATLDGGRFPIPPIGTVWNAIFGAIPVFGDLFSIPKKNQNVLHESLILTNSFITPTPLSLGNLYLPKSNEFEFCERRDDILKYLNGNLSSTPPIPPKIGGQASRRDTEIIVDRCYR